MWAEKMRLDWGYASTISAYIMESQRSKKGKQLMPDHINPMTAGGKTGRKSGGIPLNSPEGFRALQKVAVNL